MIWPFAPLTTYVSGTTPSIKAADLNAMQAQIALLTRLRITGRKFYDDFMGQTLADWWLASTTGSASHSLVADNAADGAGAATLIVSGTGSVTIATANPISVGARDFYMHVRARHVSGSSYNYAIGLDSSTVANKCYISVNSGGSGAMNAITGSVSTPIAGTFDNTYSDMLWIRQSGVLTVYFNGTPVFTGAFTPSMGDVSLTLFNGAGAADTFAVDAVELLVDQ